jgi:hypothetical protein
LSFDVNGRSTHKGAVTPPRGDDTCRWYAAIADGNEYDKDGLDDELRVVDGNADWGSLGHFRINLTSVNTAIGHVA